MTPSSFAAGAATKPPLRRPPGVVRQVGVAGRTSRRLARAVFHPMLRRGREVERQPLLVGRFVEIGAAVSASSASCLPAERRVRSGPNNAGHAGLPTLAKY